MLFKLYQLSVSLFAIVEVKERTSDMPITAHGFLKVVDCCEPEYTAILVNGKMSKKLTESMEIEFLKKSAIELTEEAVADEFATD